MRKKSKKLKFALPSNILLLTLILRKLSLTSTSVFGVAFAAALIRSVAKND